MTFGSAAGFRPRIAGGRDQDHTLGSRVLHCQLQQRIIGARKAHIDDTSTFTDRPIHSVENVLRGRFGGLPGRRAKGRDGEDPRCGCYPQDPLVRHNGTDHAGPVRMRLFRAAGGVVLLDDSARKIGMIDVDLGIDDGDQHIVTGCDFVDFAKPQLANDILAGRARFRAGRKISQIGILQV